MVSTRSQISEQRALVTLAVLALLVGGLVIRPYLQYILFAVVLAYIWMPAQNRLEQFVRPMTAALTITIAAVLVIIIPSIYILARALRQGLLLLNALEEGRLNTAVLEEWLARFGYEISFEVGIDTSQEPIAQALQRLAVGTINIARGVPDLLIGLTITLFVLFTLLRDGNRLRGWTLDVVPVRDDICEQFLGELDRLMYAAVVGNVAVAAIQGVLFAAGLWLAGFSNVIFLGVATFIAGVLPLIGVFAIWVPLAAYLFATGSPLAGGFLVVFGSIISVSDFYLRPAVIGHSGALSAAIVVVGIFGGIVAVGAVGLFVGPVMLGGAKVALDLYAEERNARQRPAE